MLNQLIESKNHTEENARKNGFLVGTLGVLVAVLLTGWTYSLFAKNFGLNAGEFELSSIVAPVAAPAEEPPPPEPEQNIERRQAANSDERPTVVEKNPTMEASLNNPPRIEDSRPLNSKPLNPSDFKNYALGAENKYRSTSERTDGIEPGKGINQPTTPKPEDEEKVPEVVVKPTPKPSPKKPPTQSLGVVNGRAAYLATPPYPPAAKLVRAQGAVHVQVLIDETGKVVSASAVSGHPLLRAVSENAARQSRFTPTLLSNQPVKVTGVIIYQFKP